MKSDCRPAVKIGFDRQLISTKGNSVRYLVVEVAAPAEEPGHKVERQQLNLGIVIDASGSMSGERLTAAKQAARGVVDSLCQKDALSLIAFDSVSKRLLGACPMDPAGRSHAQRLIAGLRSGSNTNLAAGWLDGAELVAEEMERTNGRVNRVLLLSDGHANEGVVDPRELSSVAAGLRERGVLTSTVGIGDDYSTDQIKAIAEYGGGLMHDAETPEEIVDVVMGEFGEILHTFAEDTKLLVEHDPQVKVEVLGEFPFEQSKGRTTCNFGSLAFGRCRTVVLKTTCPPGAIGKRLGFKVVLACKPAKDNDQPLIEGGTVELTFADKSAVLQQQRDDRRALIAAEHWQVFALSRALQMNQDGESKAARNYLEQELPFFRRYCIGLPGARSFPDEMANAARRFHGPLEQRLHKDLHHDMYAALKGKSDFRRRERLGWKERLKEAGYASGSSAAVRGVHSGTTAVRCPLELRAGHLIMEIHGLRALLDTGSPVSVGPMRSISICGHGFRVAPDMEDMDLESICSFVRTPVDLVLGADILSQFDLHLDLEMKSCLLSLQRLSQRGHRVPLQSIQGVPLVYAEVESNPVRLFFDTGAYMSYVNSAIPHSQASSGETEDFFPLFGRFTTPTFTLHTQIGGAADSLKFGKLPALLEEGVRLLGADGVLGNEILSCFRVTLSMRDKTMYLEESQQ